MKRILMVGSGGREHAIASACSQSPHVETICVFGTNVGLSKTNKVEVLGEKQPDIKGLLEAAVANDVTLTVVGPEAPLADGIVDVFRNERQTIFGPTRAASQLEASKWFAKQVMIDSGVPTAFATLHNAHNDALRELKERGAPIVVKLDGLAGGKGVTVCDTVGQACSILNDIYTKNPKAELLLEDKLQPHPQWHRAELSVIGIVDHHGGYQLFPAAQDYKPAFDDDQGPNTGGMGCYAPVPEVTQEFLQETVGKLVFEPIIKQMQRQNTPFSGVLYAGLMVTVNGVEVVEFNVRFGDPECQVLMRLLDSDLVPMLYEVASGGRVEKYPLRFKKNTSALGVVIAQEGYPPGSVPCKIPGHLFGDGTYHAGTGLGEDKAVMATGGRSLLVTAVGQTVSDARQAVYTQIGTNPPPGLRWRTDIGEGIE